MKTKLFFPVALFLLILGGCYHATQTSSDSSGNNSLSSSSSSVTDSSSVTLTVASKVVEMTSDGFSPSTLEISAGTTVEFVNKDAEMHWPASGSHPTHQDCAGFDALKGVESGKSYFYTFMTSKTCSYHDHINPGLKGTIVVK